MNPPAPHPTPRPPAASRAPRRRRTRTRGGGWLLPEPVLPRLPTDPPAGPAGPRATGHGLAHLESALDARSALDRCRWLRLQAEAARWAGPIGAGADRGVKSGG